MTHVVPKDRELTECNAEALADKVIGALAGSTQAEYVAAEYPGADVRLCPSQAVLNLDMGGGRIDVMVHALPPSIAFVDNMPKEACCKLAGAPITDVACVGDRHRHDLPP